MAAISTRRSARLAAPAAGAAPGPSRGSQRAALTGAAICELPAELGDLLLSRLDAKALCAVACCCRVLNRQAGCERRWRRLFEEAHGAATPNQAAAAALASGWKALLIAKAQAPEFAPCKWEVQAALGGITACAGGEAGLAVCVLIDGSGSMAAGDFESMTGVVLQLAESLKANAGAQLSVIQFSGRAQVEVPLQAPAELDCAAAMKRVTRMNGGTNMAGACAHAAAEMVGLPPATQRVIVLMSDFRIDDYSASEAVAAAKAVAEEQPRTAFFALGVGRFVDIGLVQELLSAGSPPQKLDSYLSLGWQPDSALDDY